MCDRNQLPWLAPGFLPAFAYVFSAVGALYHCTMLNVRTQMKGNGYPSPMLLKLMRLYTYIHTVYKPTTYEKPYSHQIKVPPHILQIAHISVVVLGMAVNNTFTGGVIIGDTIIEGGVFFGNRNICESVSIGNTTINYLAKPLSLSFYTEGEENKQPDEKSNGQGKLNQGDGHTLANPLSLSFYTEGEENKQPDEKSNGQGKLNQGDGHTLANPLSLSFYTEGEENKQPDEKSNGHGKLNQGDGRTIGKVFVSNIEIAKGSNGTIVLEGTYEVRPVAVKRLVKGYHDVADKEYQNLCVSDRHSNIVRLYGVEEDQDFVYLALERCTGSLNDLIQMQLLDAPTTSGDQATEVNTEYKVRLQSMKGTLPEVKLWEDNGYPSPTLWKLMRDMVSGLVHLHELGMIHRDLKPQNVLIVKEGSLCAKLADMGISKRLVGDKSSLGNHATGKYS
ncbi:hypothetical protein RHGRI_030366 [Rhododendron griersonianum]|uniref:non-specific serine/threonine protein kinase n=1 Tax=Rhododendron griersonianum TaxID=479676 RepID=A0AAV6INC2_9ERIC|nr:hypothetical protein RHGRI_030366 [Rhododendron griersonianum]